MYHRVADLPSDPQLLGVAPSHFAEHMEILRKRYQPVPLLHLANLLKGIGPFLRPARADVYVHREDGVCSQERFRYYHR